MEPLFSLLKWLLCFFCLFSLLSGFKWVLNWFRILACFKVLNGYRGPVGCLALSSWKWGWHKHCFMCCNNNRQQAYFRPLSTFLANSYASHWAVVDLIYSFLLFRVHTKHTPIYITFHALVFSYPFVNWAHPLYCIQSSTGNVQSSHLRPGMEYVTHLNNEYLLLSYYRRDKFSYVLSHMAILYSWPLLRDSCAVNSRWLKI